MSTRKRKRNLSLRKKKKERESFRFMQILHTKLFVLGRGVHDNVSFLFSSLFLFVHNKQPHTHTHRFYSKAKTHIQRQKKNFEQN